MLICRCAENLSNLSVVYRQVGQPRLAELAREKAQAANAADLARQKNANLSAGGAVEWVDTAALVQSPDQWADPPARPATSAGQEGPAPAKPVYGMAPAFGPPTLR